MPDIVDAATRSRMMASIRGRDTLPEMRVRRAVHQAGFRFRLHARALPGRPYLVLRKHRAVILVHGCFWHRHDGCLTASTLSANAAFWQAKFSANVARDARNRQALPEDFQPAPLLFYNTQIFEKAGEKPPTPDATWADFLEQAKRLTKGSGDVADVYGYSSPKWTYEQYVYNHGGQTVDNVENPTKCLLDSTQAIQGLEFMVDLQHKHRVMPSPQVMTGANIPSENNWFLGGRLATLNGGTWFTGNLNTAKDNLPWAMTLAPKGQDGKAHYPTGGAGWAIPTSSKNADAAWAWMSWQFGPAGWKSWIAKRDPKTFWLPALKSIATDEAKRLEQFYPNASLVVRSADSIWFRPGGAKWEKANTEILGPALTSLHENKAPVKTTI